MQYQIVDDVQIPEFTPPASRARYPFADMQVGQSFAAPQDETSVAKLQNAFKAYVTRQRKIDPSTTLAFHAAERVRDDGVVEVRCWRTA